MAARTLNDLRRVFRRIPIDIGHGDKSTFPRVYRSNRFPDAPARRNRSPSNNQTDPVPKQV